MNQCCPVMPEFKHRVHCGSNLSGRRGSCSVTGKETGWQPELAGSSADTDRLTGGRPQTNMLSVRDFPVGDTHPHTHTHTLIHTGQT